MMRQMYCFFLNYAQFILPFVQKTEDSGVSAIKINGFILYCAQLVVSLRQFFQKGQGYE